MNLKNDLMYPFGNPFKERVAQGETITALSNVVKLAKDKLKMSRGEMEDILLSGQGGGSADDVIAEQSVHIIESLLQYLNAEKETNT